MGGCSGAAGPPPSADKVYEVAEILKRCGAFLGKPVQAAGYLATCQGYDCHLFTSKAGADAWYGYINRGEATASEEPKVVIGIGFESEAFDAKAAPLQRSYVVIAGRMDERSCDGAGGSDRSPGIHPTDVRVWTPAEGAPTT
jgi:hypothetical protein